MLDDPAKTQRLVARLQARLPFEVQLSRAVVDLMRTESVAADTSTRYTVRQISYAGDEGGIMCHVDIGATGRKLVVSLTHVIAPASADVTSYQKHRISKLRTLDRT